MYYAQIIVQPRTRPAESCSEDMTGLSLHLTHGNRSRGKAPVEVELLRQPQSCLEPLLDHIHWDKDETCSCLAGQGYQASCCTPFAPTRSSSSPSVCTAQPSTTISCFCCNISSWHPRYHVQVPNTHQTWFTRMRSTGSRTIAAVHQGHLNSL